MSNATVPERTSPVDLRVTGGNIYCNLECRCFLNMFFGILNASLSLMFNYYWFKSCIGALKLISPLLNILFKFQLTLETFWFICYVFSDRIFLNFLPDMYISVLLSVSGLCHYCQFMTVVSIITLSSLLCNL
jgi:hypothetical protein